MRKRNIIFFIFLVCWIKNSYSISKEGMKYICAKVILSGMTPSSGLSENFCIILPGIENVSNKIQSNKAFTLTQEDYFSLLLAKDYLDNEYENEESLTEKKKKDLEKRARNDSRER